MKIVFLGGGALRLLGVVNEIHKRPSTFKKLHLVFMDLDLDAAEIVSSLASRMPSAVNNDATYEATNDLSHAIDGADFVYCCIRAGGVESLDRDKRIAASYGYHGHDDYGPSAVMLTWRTVPAILEITEQMQRLCPEATLMIFTNPIATLVDAVKRYTSIRCLGLCPGVYNFAYDMDHLFGVGTPCDGLKYRGGGLNHLSWVTEDATLNGELVIDVVMRSFDSLGSSEGAPRCGWERMAPLIKLYGRMFLNNGHQHHFFYHDELAQKLADHYENTPTNTQRSQKQHDDRKLARHLAQQTNIESYWQQRPLDRCLTEPLGDIGVQFMEAALLDNGAELGVTIPNDGHIKGIMPGASVEGYVRVYRNRLEPIALDPIPDSLKGLCQATAQHQRCLVDASVNRNRGELFQAMLAEPTIRSFERAQPMFDELWQADKSLSQ